MNHHREQLSPSPDPEPTTTPAPPPFWSPWATAGWGVLVVITFVAIQLIALGIWVAFRLTADPDLDRQVLLEAAENSDLFAVATLATSVICSALVWLVVRLKRGSDPPVTLALDRPSRAALVTWLLITAGCAVLSDALTLALGRPIVPEVMTEIFRTAAFPALLWFSVIIAGPFFEEFFVRGFLLEGLRRGRMGNVGAVVVCSLFWASIHLQYGPYEIITIFVFGLILGAARLKTGSLWVPIAMHVLANLVASVEAEVILRSTEALPI